MSLLEIGGRRSSSRADGFDIGDSSIGGPQGFAGNGEEIAKMFARCQFRDYPAVLSMKPNLGGDDIGQDSAFAYNGCAGFIAGSFEGQEGHGATVRHFPALAFWHGEA